jgi:hypothetical protein
MPHKKKIEVPDWVDAIDNLCLRHIIVEGLVARRVALDHGALDHPKCRAVLEGADKTLDRIADGRVVGDIACKKASDALRKYNTACECMHPTATARRG